MKPILTMLAAFLVACPLSALSQAPKPPTSAAVVASEPGKAAAVETIEVTATVVAIDKATRTITLKGPKRTVDMVAGNEVRNFDQIRVGDAVVAKYVQALTLELKKTKAPLDAKEEVSAARATPGNRPAGAVGRQVTVLADVVGVDPKNRVISLKGPRGNVIDLDVKNPDHFKVVKKGDQVEVVYTEALALVVTPAPKKSDTKKK
jgi:hypothetical protein